MGKNHVPKGYAALIGIDLYGSDGSKKHDNGTPVFVNCLQGCVSNVDAIRQFLLPVYNLEYASILTSTAAGTNKHA